MRIFWKYRESCDNKKLELKYENEHISLPSVWWNRKPGENTERGRGLPRDGIIVGATGDSMRPAEDTWAEYTIYSFMQCND